MSNVSRLGFVGGLAAVMWVGTAVGSFAQVLPNPYRTVDDWAQLPGGREMGAVGGVTVDPDGDHIWAVVRCDATDLSVRQRVPGFGSGPDPQVRSGRQRRRELRERDVHMAPRDRCGPRRQRLGDRRRQRRANPRWNTRPPGHQVQPGWEGVDDPRHTRSSGRGSEQLQRSGRRRRG